MAVACRAILYAVTDSTKNLTCPFNQELELLAMQRSQSQTAVYSNAAPGSVIHSST